MIKFLEGYFNISQNFKEFLSLLKKKAGLLIISYNKIKININNSKKFHVTGSFHMYFTFIS